MENRNQEEHYFLPLKFVILPTQEADYYIFEDKLKEVIKKAFFSKDKKIVFIYSKVTPPTKIKSIDDINQVGCLCYIKKFKKDHLYVYGLKRVLIKDINCEKFSCEIEDIPEKYKLKLDATTKVYLEVIGKLFIEYNDLIMKDSDYIEYNINVHTFYNLVFFPSEIVMQTLDSHAKYFSFDNQLKLLNEINDNERVKLYLDILKEEVEALKIKKKIIHKAMEELDKDNKKIFLQKQLEYIKKELGENNNDVDEYEKILEKKNLPEYAKEKLKKQIKKLKKLPPFAPESGMVRNYIETVLDLPWGKTKQPRQNLREIKRILDKNHYGLERVKERILEHIAVYLNTKKPPKTILCLEGSFGVGKTSLVKSIAEALDLDYYHIALGGVNDESFLRGFLSTYVNSKCGAIMKALIDCGSDNPIICLDEIDKISNSWRGDPISALIEILDPEQNYQYEDHYLELKYDISNVFFICTANYIVNIEPVLKDRLEIIHIPCYSEEEKMYIAKYYLIPKQLMICGLKNDNVIFTKSSVKKIIDDYTYEAGVRNLERNIGKICRKIVLNNLTNKKNNTNTIKVTPRLVEKYLGRKVHKDFVLENTIGVVNGLAYNICGGSLLQIEAIKIKGGEGKIEYTGNLRDIIKESIKIAFTYIKSKMDKFGLKEELFKEYDYHIHFLEGAIPKDGPSAGIAITTALLSIMLEKPVSKDWAFTGEISLSGEILPVGGLREKILAGKRNGIKKFIIPEKNITDMKEIDKHILKDVDIFFVKKYDEVYEIVFD